MFNLLLEIIINTRIQITGHGVVHMESNCVLLTKFYPLRNTRIKGSN